MQLLLLVLSLLFSGKSIENQKNRINVKICTTAEKLRKYVRKPSFQAIRVFDDNLAAVQLYRERVKLNKPITVGFSILELSKLRMYQFWYDFVQVAFQDAKVSLLMSDTDSFLMKIEGEENVQGILRQYSDRFDLSQLRDGHPLRSDRNKQQPGKMKLQLPNETCLEVVVLSSKCYSILTDQSSCSAMKGVPGRLTHDVYRDCIENGSCFTGRVNSVKHFNQSLYQVSTERRMLSPLDTKRHYFSANESISFGHYKLKE